MFTLCKVKVSMLIENCNYYTALLIFVYETKPLNLFFALIYDFYVIGILRICSNVPNKGNILLGFLFAVSQ